MQHAAGGQLLERFNVHGCKAALDDYRVRGMRLVKIEGSSPDGRASNAVLVRTIVLREGKSASTLLRVEKLDGEWKLTML